MVHTRWGGGRFLRSTGGGVENQCHGAGGGGGKCHIVC